MSAPRPAPDVPEALAEQAAPEASAAPELVEARLARCLRAYAAPLARLFASYARSAADRDDLAQDVAMALWTALPRFRGDCAERTFVLRVAHNRALAFLAKRGVATIDVDEAADRVAATSGKNPAVAFERGERATRLLAAVRALPVAHRQVMTLLLEGLGHREIAEVLGTTENNVAVRASRARAALRVLLGEEERP
jgi:RNA polymerase sigma-70 factor (ECF subfamily)